MTFSTLWFTVYLDYIMYVSYLIYALILAYYARPTQWKLWNNQRFAVATGVMLLLWLFQVRLESGHLGGMTYHLLGLSWVSLLLGTSGAWVLGSIFLLIFGILDKGLIFLKIFSFNAICLLLPALLINKLLRMIIEKKYLPKQLFIYIFMCGFGSGALGMLATGLVLISILHVAQVFSLLGENVAWKSAFPVFFLMMWGEGFLSGIGTAILVALKPELLGTFKDEDYLTEPKKQIWRD